MTLERLPKKTKETKEKGGYGTFVCNPFVIFVHEPFKTVGYEVQIIGARRRRNSP